MDYSRYTSLTKDSFNTITPTTTTTLEPLFFTYNSNLSIIIYTSCKTTVFSKINIKKHLKDLHIDYYNNTSNIKDIIKTLERLDLEIPNTRGNIPSNTYYFKDLELNFNTFSCPECNYISLSNKKIRNHLNSIHFSKSTTTKKREDIIINILVQLLYPSLNKGLFIPLLPEPIIIDNTLNNSFNAIEEDNIPSSSSSSTSTPEVPSSSNLFTNYLNRKEILYNNIRAFKNNSSLPTKYRSSFLKNSRFNLFLENKPIPELVDLLDNKNEEILKDLGILDLEGIIYRLSKKISSIIPFIIRRIRRDILNTSLENTTLESKDFIELEDVTKKSYYKVFSNLAIFIIRLYLIRNNIIETTFFLEPFIKEELIFSEELNTIINDIIELLKDRSIIETSNDKREELEGVELDNRLINLFIELLKIPILFSTTKEYTTFQNPTIVFYIIASINPTTLGFRDEGFISKLGSKILYNARLYFIGFINQALETTPNLDLEGFYKENSIRLIKNTSSNYFEEILNIRAYSLKINKDLESINRLILEIDSNTILVYNKKYIITGLKELNLSLLIKLKNILFNDLISLDSNILPKLNLDNIEDNSFLNTPTVYIIDNINLESIQDFLLKLLLNPKSSLYRKYIKKIDPELDIPVFRVSTIANFYNKRRDFLKILGLAIYISSGSPLRGEELVSIIFRNTRDKTRDIIFKKEYNLMEISTSYYKSYNITRKNKINIRFLSPTLSIILFYYLIYIVPFYDYLNIYYLNKEEVSYLLLEDRGKPFTGATISNTLFKESSAFFREGLTLNPYRHLINYILKERLNYSKEDLEEDLNEEEDIIDL